MKGVITNTAIAIQVLSATVNQENLLRIVDSVTDYIASTGRNYQVGPLKTTVEGGYEELLDIIEGVQLVYIRRGTDLVKSYVKIFYNPENHLLIIDGRTKKYR